MIVVTLSNWRRKLRMLIALLLLLAVVLVCGILFLDWGQEAATTGDLDNDRNSSGSLKVEASPAPNGTEHQVSDDTGWWERFLGDVSTNGEQ